MQQDLTGSALPPRQVDEFNGLALPLNLRKRVRPGETVIQVGLRLAGLVSVLTTAGIILVLIFDAIKFFMRPEPTLWEFFTGTIWQPQ